MITPLRLLALSLCLSALPLCAGAAAPPDTTAGFFKDLQAGKKQTVVVYGTSLTHGGAWAGAMKQWFEKKSPGKVTFVNSGGPGMNSDWGLKNLPQKVLKHHPDLVLIEFSYNDAHDKFNLPLAQGKTNLEAMISQIKAQSASTCIVLQVMNANWDSPNGKGSSSHRPQLEAFNDNYRQVARDQNLILLDHYPVWLQLKNTDKAKFQAFVPDGTHPTRAGSLAVTWPTIQAWLEKGSATR